MLYVTNMLLHSIEDAIKNMTKMKAIFKPRIKAIPADIAAPLEDTCESLSFEIK